MTFWTAQSPHFGLGAATHFFLSCNFNLSRRMLRPDTLIKFDMQTEGFGRWEVTPVSKFPEPVRQPQGLSL